jgi:hypothetical protein
MEPKSSLEKIEESFWENSVLFLRKEVYQQPDLQIPLLVENSIRFWPLLMTLLKK